MTTGLQVQLKGLGSIIRYCLTLQCLLNGAYCENTQKKKTIMCMAVCMCCFKIDKSHDQFIFPLSRQIKYICVLKQKHVQNKMAFKKPLEINPDTQKRL